MDHFSIDAWTIIQLTNTSITGDEVSVRNAIKDTIEIFSVIDISDLRENDDLNFNKHDVLFVLDQIRYIEDSLNIIIPYPYNINIFSHLYSLINRTRNIGYLEFNKVISDVELNKMKQDFVTYKTIKTILNKIEFHLQSKVDEIEGYFLYQHIISSSIQGKLSQVTAFSEEVTDITNYYIQSMIKVLDIDVENDSLFSELGNHIKPMLNRLKHHIVVRNSLLEDIKFAYGDIYKEVEIISNRITNKFILSPISDDENGFITLYFAKLIETHEANQIVKVVIMCTTGIGTSELLRTKVSKSFKNIEIIDVVSTDETQGFAIKYPDVDLILSTVRISQEQIPVLVVSAMFTEKDKKRLSSMIRGINHDQR